MHSPKAVVIVRNESTSLTGLSLTRVNVLINYVTCGPPARGGLVTDFVTVEASAALRKLESRRQREPEVAGYENLPLSGYRNFQSLINLVHATPVRFQNAAIDTPNLVHGPLASRRRR